MSIRGENFSPNLLKAKLNTAKAVPFLKRSLSDYKESEDPDFDSGAVSEVEGADRLLPEETFAGEAEMPLGMTSTMLDLLAGVPEEDEEDFEPAMDELEADFAMTEEHDVSDGRAAATPGSTSILLTILSEPAYEQEDDEDYSPGDEADDGDDGALDFGMVTDDGMPVEMLGRMIENAADGIAEAAAAYFERRMDQEMDGEESEDEDYEHDELEEHDEEHYEHEEEMEDVEMIDWDRATWDGEDGEEVLGEEAEEADGSARDWASEAPEAAELASERGLESTDDALMMVGQRQHIADAVKRIMRRHAPSKEEMAEYEAMHREIAAVEKLIGAGIDALQTSATPLKLTEGGRSAAINLFRQVVVAMAEQATKTAIKGVITLDSLAIALRSLGRTLYAAREIEHDDKADEEDEEEEMEELAEDDEEPMPPLISMEATRLVIANILARQSLEILPPALATLHQAAMDFASQQLGAAAQLAKFAGRSAVTMQDVVFSTKVGQAVPAGQRILRNINL